MTGTADTTSAELRARVVREFEERFGAPPTFLARAPGRVNLVGDHTDYTDGFVLPMAIDRSVWIALRPRNDRRVVVYSLDFDERAGFDLDAEMSSALTGGERKGWIEYVHGVAWSLRDAGYPLGRGWDGVAAGDVPVSAGLASSAALELATARAFAGLGGLAWEPIAMARLAQRAETEWVGVTCGIMDQLISAAGRGGHALLIDSRSLQMRAVPIPADVSVVVLDTATRRGPVDSVHDERRAQCEAAAAFFGVAALRDVDRAAFSARAAELTRHFASARAMSSPRTSARSPLRRRSKEVTLNRSGVSWTRAIAACATTSRCRAPSWTRWSDWLAPTTVVTGLA